MSLIECKACHVDLNAQQYQDTYASPIEGHHVPHCFKCGYEIKTREVDELKAHIKDLQKILEGASFVSRIVKLPDGGGINNG